MAERTTPIVTDRGAHERTWSRVSYTTNSKGQTEAVTNLAFVELSTGLHYWDGDAWQESDPRIEILPNETGAAVSKAPHKVIFPASSKLPKNFQPVGVS